MKVCSGKWKWHIRGPISLCMVANNEAMRLDRCLRNIVGLVDEIIIVDTGSEDKTIEVAKSYGAKVIQDPWQDDFARPRNIGIENARMDWILVMDPDEILSRIDFYKVRMATVQGKILAWRMETWNYTNNRGQQGFRVNPGKYPEGKGWAGYVGSTKTRLFRRETGIRFRGCWHELLDYDILQMDVPVANTDIHPQHFGDEIHQKDMEERKWFYLRMGEKKVRQEPGNSQAWWELAISENNAGYVQRAYKSMVRCLGLGGENTDRLFFISQLANRSGDKHRGTYYFEKATCKLFPNLTQIDKEGKRKYGRKQIKEEKIKELMSAGGAGKMGMGI